MQTVREVAQSRRTRRVLIGLLIFLVLFGLLGFFAAPPLIRHVAEQQLSKQLDRPATIGRIALNPYTLRLEADNVHIGERGGAGDFVDISRLIVKPSWSSLFRGAPIVDEVQLDSSVRPGMRPELCRNAGRRRVRSSKPAGSGVGMLLARRVVENQGGKLDVVSSTQGTTVRVLLPAA